MGTVLLIVAALAVPSGCQLQPAVCVPSASGGFDPLETVRVQMFKAEAEEESVGGRGFAFCGTRSRTFPGANPSALPGTNHEDDPAAHDRIDAFSAQVEPYTELVVRPHDDGPAADALLDVGGCVPNEPVLERTEDFGGTCDPAALGRSLTFANVQLARIAPDGPFHIYEDYMIQTMPLAYDVGGCIAGAWLCDGDTGPFDGVTVIAYPSSFDILSVRSSTSDQGPGAHTATRPTKTSESGALKSSFAI